MIHANESVNCPRFNLNGEEEWGGGVVCKRGERCMCSSGTKSPPTDTNVVVTLDWGWELIDLATGVQIDLDSVNGHLIAGDC